MGMDKIKQYLSKESLVPAGVGLVLGLIIGWFVIGWGVWPVNWVNAEAQHLRPDLQAEWLKMTIQSFEKTGNSDQAIARWESLGDAAPALLDQLRTDPDLNIEKVNAFSELVKASAAVAPATEKAAGPNWMLLLGVLCVLGLVIGGAFAYIFLIRGRRKTSEGEETPMSEAHRLSREADRTDFAAEGADVPIAQFMTTYKLGNNFYDDSFSIDSPAGEFLGECGVGISEAIGVGDPKKVTAFEVWLFDKNDIQTVTKVVMSDHGFNDQALRQKLSAKGDPVRANIGDQVELETATLVLAARIVDMEYAQGALPEKSYFDRITIELAVWPKE
jgi:hypothetical protein